MNKHIKALASVALAAAVAVTMSIPVLGTGRAYAADTADTAETASTDIVSDLGMFTPLSGDTVTVNRNNATVKVKFSTKSMSRQYTKLALVSQTKSDAEKNKSAASASVSETSTGKYSSTFTISIPVEKIGTKLPVSYYQKFTKSDGTKVDGWYNFDAQHYLTVVNTPDIVSQLEDAIYYQEWTKTTNRLCAQARKSWDALTDAEKHDIIYSVEIVMSEPTDDGSTAAVDNSTTLSDAAYKPDGFTYAGGTGKVSISCSRVTVSGGKSYATIVFSSAYYTKLRASGRIYNASVDKNAGTSTFVIPIKVNTANTVIGTTTAMTESHGGPARCRYNDRIYLFGSYGFYHHICR